MKMTQDGRNITLFMLLGDGYLNRKNLCISQCKKQLDYVIWKRSLLVDNGIECNQVRFNDNNGYGAYEFTTKPYRFLALYKKIIYCPKKTISNRKLLNRLNPLGLAIWYMDDGGLSQKKKNGKIHANDLMLNTHLSKNENQIIIDYFKDVWDIRFSQVKNKRFYRLRCGTIEARKFISIVEEYVKQVPSMSHKLNIRSAISLPEMG